MKSIIIAFIALGAVLGVNCDDVRISFSTLSGTSEPFHSHNLTLPAGLTLHDVMDILVILDPEWFTYESEYFPGLGAFITKIGELENNYDEKVAWMLYILPEYPDPAQGTPGDEFLSKYGVDGIEIANDKHYMFAYTEYHLERN